MLHKREKTAILQRGERATGAGGAGARRQAVPPAGPPDHAGGGAAAVQHRPGGVPVREPCREAVREWWGLGVTLSTFCVCHLAAYRDLVAA